MSDNDFPAEVVERIAAELETLGTPHGHAHEQARWVLAEIQRRCEVAAREAVFMSDGAVQSPLPRKPQDIIAAATAKAMSMKEQG